MKNISFQIDIITHGGIISHHSNTKEIEDEDYDTVSESLKETFGHASKGELNFFSFYGINNNHITIGKELLIKSIFTIKGE